MVLKASVAPTAVPAAAAVAELSASISEPLRADTERSPPAEMRLSSTVLRTCVSTALVAIRPLSANEASARSSSCGAASSPVSGKGSAGGSSAAGSSAEGSSGAVSSASSSASSVSSAVITDEPRASMSTSPATETVARSTRVSTTLRMSLRTSLPPTDAAPLLEAEPPMRAATPAVSLARARRSPPTTTASPSVTVCGRSSSVALELSRLLARTKPTAAPPLELTELTMVAVICGTETAATTRSPATSIVTPSMRTSTDAGASVPTALVPRKVSRAAAKMFCACQPMVLKASTAPTAVPPLSVDAVFVAVIDDSLAALTASPPSSETIAASSTRASTCDSTRLVAMSPLTATEEPAPPAASAPPSAAASPSGAPASSPAASAAPPSPSNPDSLDALTVPLSVASMCAPSVASTTTSPPAVRLRYSTSDSTSARTSLRTTMPPTATLEPPEDDSALIVTSATISADSAAATVTAPPTSICERGCAPPAPRSVAWVAVRMRLLARMADAPTLVPAPLEATLASLRMFAAMPASSLAVTLTSPPAVRSLRSTTASMASGFSVVPMSVPSRLFRPAAAMLPMSQPMALKASVAPAAEPDDEVTAVPAADSADSAEPWFASTMTLPSAVSTRVSIRWAWIDPVSWFQAKVPPRARLNPESPPASASASASGAPVSSSTASSSAAASSSASASDSTTAIDSVTAPSSAAPLAIRARSPASITERRAEASIARSTVLLAEAMPTLMLSSIGTSAEKPALLALKTVASRASTVTGPGAATSASASTARVTPRPLLAATLPLLPWVAPDSA